jgi:hypothetical protein
VAAQDTGNATWRRDVSVSLWKLAETDGGGVPWTQVLERVEEMKARGVLLPTDERLLEQARRLAGAECSPTVVSVLSVPQSRDPWRVLLVIPA